MIKDLFRTFVFVCVVVADLFVELYEYASRDGKPPDN